MSDIEDPQATAPIDEAPADPGITDEPTTDAGAGDGGGWDDDVAGIPREKAVRIAQIGLVVLALIVVAVVLISKSGNDDKGSSATDKNGGSSVSTTVPKPKKASWPANLNGRPVTLGTTGQVASKVTPKAKPGVYIWSDFDGMHIWVVKGEGVPTITGTLDSNDKIQKAVTAVDGSGDVTVDGKRVSFNLPGKSPIEGVDFNPGFYGNKIVISLNGPDGPVDATLVKVGKKGDPAPFPLVFERTVQK